MARASGKKRSSPSKGKTVPAKRPRRAAKGAQPTTTTTSGPAPPPGFEAFAAYFQQMEERMVNRLDAVVENRVAAVLASKPHPPGPAASATQTERDPGTTSAASHQDIQGTGLTLGQVMQATQPDSARLPTATGSSPHDAAVASSHSGNEPQASMMALPPNIVSMASHPFPIDARVPVKLRAKIIAREFIDFGHLLNPTKFAKAKLEMEDEADGSVTFVRKAGPECFTQSLKSLTEWDTAFAIYTTVYAAAHPQEVSGLVKFGEKVKKIARKGGNWQHYDINFRVLLQVDPTMAWSFHHSELYDEAIMDKRGQQAQAPSNAQSFRALPGRTYRVPRGWCTTYHRGGACHGCNYKHACPKCSGAHPGYNCQSPGKPRPQADHRPTQQPLQAIAKPPPGPAVTSNAGAAKPAAGPTGRVSPHWLHPRVQDWLSRSKAWPV